MFNQLSAMELLETFSISGRLTDRNGRPMEGVPVTIYGTVIITKLTCCNGRYSFTGLPGWGRYQIAPGNVLREGAHWQATPDKYEFNGLTSNEQADFLYEPQYG